MTIQQTILPENRKAAVAHLRKLAAAHGYYLMPIPPNKIDEMMCDRKVKAAMKRKKFTREDIHYVIRALKTMKVTSVRGLFEFYNEG